MRMDSFLVVAALSALAASPAVELGEQQVAAQELVVDTGRSVLVAKVKKAGLMRFLGHEHGVVPGAWLADVRFDPTNLEGSSITVDLDAAELIVDSEEARRRAGVDTDGPSESDVVEIQAKMLSAEQIDAAAFPAIRFASQSLRLRSDDELRIEGSLTLHGVTRRLRVDAALESQGAGYLVHGTFEIKLRDFGIEPVSIGGVVKVADEVEIRFEIYASASR